MMMPTLLDLVADHLKITPETLREAISRDDLLGLLGRLHYEVLPHSNVVQVYAHIECPDCGEDLPMVPGSECANCHHVYWPERNDD